MPVGRRPVPTALRRLTGTEHRIANPTDEPVAPMGVPACPDHLDGYARQFWLETGAILAALSIASPVDAGALAAAASLYASAREASDAIEAVGNGGYYIDPAGVWRVHPAVRVKIDAEHKLRLWYIEFGLTPAARSRVKVRNATNSITADYFKG